MTPHSLERSLLPVAFKQRKALPDMNSSVSETSTAAEKVALFRSLFRGREDVYPRRFESRKTGRSGYAPACANEWVRGVCDKPRIKCADCPNRQFLAITDDVITWHLSGRDPQGREFVMGVYSMLQDETCFFLAADFDGDAWQMDAQAFLATAARARLACRTGTFPLRQRWPCLVLL